MSIEEVAARAGVGKTTIYRRWPSKGLLALDAFVDSFREEQPLPDTGTLRGDLLSALHAWVRAVTQTAMGPMLTGLIAEAQHDPELRGAWRDRVLEPLRQQHRVMLDRAIARGEIAASVDRDVVLDLFFGAAEHRLRPDPAAGAYEGVEREDRRALARRDQAVHVRLADRHGGREQQAMEQVIGVMIIIVVIGLLADKIFFSPIEKFLYRRWGTSSQ